MRMPQLHHTAFRRVVTASLMAAVTATSLAADRIGPALDRPAVSVRSPERAVLLSVVHTGQRWLAVGERGLIVRSDDAGRTWRQSPSPVSTTLTSVRFVNASHGLAVGHAGVVLRSDDGGLTWQRCLDGHQLARQVLADARARGDANAVREAERGVAEGADKPLLDVLWLAPQRALVVGAYGLALATADGGRTWQSWMDRLPNPKGLHWYAARQHGSRIVLVGEQGLVALSDDQGRGFRRLTLPYTGSFFTLEMPDAAEIVIAGLRGNVWRSADGGARWSALAVPTTAAITASHTGPPGALWLADQAGHVMVRRGDAFVPLHHAPLPPLHALASGPQGQLWAASIQGLLPLSAKP